MLNIFSIIPLVCKQPYLCKCGTWEIPFIAHASFSTACRKRKPWCNGVGIWDQSRTGIDSAADWHLKFKLVLCWNVSHKQNGTVWHWNTANEYLNFGFQWWLLGGYSNICYCTFATLYPCVLVTQWSFFLRAFVKVNACDRGQRRDRWHISQIHFSFLRGCPNGPMSVQSWLVWRSKPNTVALSVHNISPCVGHVGSINKFNSNMKPVWYI